MLKPSKTQIIVNSIAAIATAAAAIAYFIAGKPAYGAIWTVITLAWVFTVVMSVKTYRLNLYTYELRQRTQRRIEELYRTRRSS